MHQGARDCCHGMEENIRLIPPCKDKDKNGNKA